MTGEHHVGRRRPAFARLLAALLSSVLTLVGFGAVAPLAHAQTTDGVTVTVLHNGSPIQDGAVVNQGDVLRVNTQYGVSTPDGAAVTIGIPDGVTLDESTLVVPPGNTAIDTITQVNGAIEIQFHNPMPDIQDGMHSLDFTFDRVERTESQTLEWQVDGEMITWQITNVTPGDQQENVSDSLAKTASGNMYERYVSVDDDGQVQLSEDLTEHEVRYTLTINTDGDTNRDGFTIADELSEYLAYNEGSFSAEITTWDEDGWNRTTGEFNFTPTFGDNSFTSTVDIPSPSELTITYTASITADNLDDIRAELQRQYEALEGGYGGIGIDLENTALFGDAETTRDASVEIGLLIPEPEPAPGPNVGQAFNKNATPGEQIVEPAEDGTLDPGAEITYTFDVNLSQWDGREDVENPEDFVLDRNVVISDTLPVQASWGTINAVGMELTEATNFDGDAAAFAAGEYVGQFFVDGQDLLINVGQDSGTDATITATALVNSVANLNNWTNDAGFTIYQLNNNAAFDYSNDDDPYRDRAEVRLVDRGDTSDGVNIPAVFSKSADDDETIYVAPGESATLNYTFEVNGWGEESVDVTNSYIVDYRDPNVFDLSDLAEIQAGISGKYHWRYELTPEHFDVSVNDAGHLVIALSDAGVDVVVNSGEGVDRNLAVNIPLTTVPLDGRQTIEVENRATLFGSDDEALYWSETTSEASSFGNEAEVRKTVRDTPNASWTQNLRAEVVDGELVQETYVYNLAYIPHGTFEGVPVTAAVDELPDNLEFLGFVTAENVDTGDNPQQGPIDIGGNLEAVYDEDAHTVTVQQQVGTVLVQEPDISANVLVRIIEFEPNVPIVNMLVNSTTTITPSDGYPLSVQKIDSEDDETVIDDPNSRFQILDENDEVVVDDAFVENGFLRVLNDEGEVTGLVVPEPGVYYVVEVVAPAGYQLDTETRIQVVVNEDGSSQQARFPNTPGDPTVEIIKGDGDADEGTIANDANTEAEAVEYEHGETRDIVINVENTGTEDLVDVVLTDETLSGTPIEGLLWTTPDGTELVAEDVDGVLTATWDGPWAPGEVITGVATLTLSAGEALHTNLASVEAEGAGSGTPVEDDDPYNANPPEPEPEIGVTKNDEGDDVHEVAVGEHDIVVTITNDGTEALENLEFSDTTESGHDAVWNAEDLEGLEGLVLEPGESYTVNGTVQVDAGQTHRNNVVITGTGVISGDTVEDEDPTTFVPPEPMVSVGDFVWVDTNRDGIQDEGEPGIPGVTLVLTGPDGEPVTDVYGNTVEPTVTDEDGFYTFEGLPVLEEGQSYTVSIDREASEEALAPYVPTLHEQGDDPAVDSSTWSTDSVLPLTEDGQRDPTLDFGFVTPSYAVGDYVWIDTNRDGIQDEDEDPLPGVTVEIYEVDEEGNRSETPVNTTTTDDNGRYIFDELPAGDYQIRFIQPDGYIFTGQNTQEDGSDQDSDADRQDGWTEVFTLDDTNQELTEDYAYQPFTATQGVDPTWDAGFIAKTYAVGDYVWIDSNGDGLQDEDEEPLPGVTVELHGVDSEGNRSEEPIATTVTDENGRYIFDELPAGDYEIRFVLTEEQAAMYEFTQQHAGDDAAADSNADAQTGWTIRFTLDDSNEALTLDYTDQAFTATQGIDPTWDAGVVLVPVLDEPVDEDPASDDPAEEDAADPSGDLPRAGAGVGLWAVVLASLLVLGGGALALIARRARSQS